MIVHIADVSWKPYAVHNKQVSSMPTVVEDFRVVAFVYFAKHAHSSHGSTTVSKHLFSFLHCRPPILPVESLYDLSTNAAIAASVVLASRLSDDISDFALVLFYVQLFSLLPI